MAGRQRFDEPTSELVYLDLLTRVDTLTARKLQLHDQVVGLAGDERWGPTVARLRTFGAIDTLTARSIHLELGGDWQRLRNRIASVLAGTDPRH